MRKKYLEPQLIVLTMISEDIVTASTVTGEDVQEDFFGFEGNA